MRNHSSALTQTPPRRGFVFADREGLRKTADEGDGALIRLRAQQTALREGNTVSDAHGMIKSKFGEPVCRLPSYTAHPSRPASAKGFPLPGRLIVVRAWQTGQ